MTDWVLNTPPVSHHFCYIENWDKSQFKKSTDPASNCMFKVNDRNTRIRCEICSLTIKTPERRQLSQKMVKHT